jgi:hypothetical protein
MTTSTNCRCLMVAGACVLAAVTAGAQSNEEFARRRLESGLSLLAARS